MTARAWLRAGLVAVTVLQAGTGAWQLLLPRSFYDDFPLPGHPWVAMLPAYNEHLMRDFGGSNLAMAVVVGVAAVSMERRLVRTAMAANLAFAVPHFVFHATRSVTCDFFDGRDQSMIADSVASIAVHDLYEPVWLVGAARPQRSGQGC